MKINIMLNCPKCAAESSFIRKPLTDNVYIVAPKQAQCRECGSKFDFHYGQVPDERDLKKAIYEACDEDLAAIHRLKEVFFWDDEKTAEQKYAVYFNILQFLNHGNSFSISEAPVVLTLWQPWASLWASGLKQIETRPRPVNYQGIILIHSAKNPPAEAREAMNNPIFKKALASIGVEGWDDLKHGHIIGAVDHFYCSKIIDPEIARTYKEEIEKGRMILPPPDPELSFGDYRPNRFAWIGRNHRQLEDPVPYTNGQGYYLRLRPEYDFSQFKFKHNEAKVPKRKTVKRKQEAA